MEIPKRYFGYPTIRDYVIDISMQMYRDNWRPDYIVGLTRGGLVPAVMLSNMTGINMHTLDVRFRDTDESYSGPESNLWMAEDAFGYTEHKDRDDTWSEGKSDRSARKNILILDDINDTGATINWIKQDWQSGCLPNSPEWETIWGNNVKFATLIHNEPSEADIDYFSISINKFEKDEWIVFPWEH